MLLLALKQYYFWLSSNTASDSQAVLLLALKQYCFWLSSNTASHFQAILLLAVKPYCFWLSSNTASDSQAMLLLAPKQYCFWLSSNTAYHFQALLLLALKPYCFCLSSDAASDSSNTASDLYSGSSPVETYQKCRLSWRDFIMAALSHSCKHEDRPRPLPVIPFWFYIQQSSNLSTLQLQALIFSNIQ